MARPERAEHVSWALAALQGQGAWWEPIVAWRVRQLQDSHNRLRALVKASRLRVQPHAPPDILGLYVLVPAGGK
jgi:hypothetical protein